jgi:Protein of unknown function (DUF2846)
MKSIFTALLTLLLALCLKAYATPTSDLKTDESPQAKVEPSKVVLYREESSIASFAAPSVFLDGVDLGKLNEGSLIEAKTQAGKHTIRIIGNFFNWPWPERSIEFQTQANRSAYIQLIIYGPGGQFSLEERPAETAEAALKSIKK